MPAVHHDVFLSHHASDKPAVEELAHRLIKSGLNPWLDTWNLIPGDPWQEAIEAALAACTTCAVFVGPSGLGPWQNEEMRIAIDRRVGTSRDGFRVIPVLLPGAQRGERGKLPAFLSAATWVEFRDTLHDELAFHRLVAGVRGVEPGPEPGQAVYQDVTPYRGLQVFDVDDWPFFFGREALVEWLLDALRPPSGAKPANRFLGIIGPSGSGKSSLARAGLVAALKQGQIPGSQHWPITICRPGADPLESLAVSICSVTRAGQDVTSARGLIRDLREDPRALHLTARLALHGAPVEWRLVVLVDQFEELFTLCHDDGLRQAAIDTLLHAATVAEGQAIVLLTLRADFYGKCAAYPALAAALSDRQVLVGPMTRDELRRAIERPARLAGREFEPGLVEMLLDDVAGQPGGLPLLQHALLELWGRRSGRKLTHAAYQEIGGVAGALERRAEAVYAGFNEVEQMICKRIFLRLTQPGEGTEDTKRRSTFQELLPSSSERPAFDTVIQTLAGSDARLVVAEGDERPGEAQFVEVAHEALIRSWGRLRGWIDAGRAALRTHRQLTEAAEEWDANARDASYLYRGVRLVEAREWAAAHSDDLNELERLFLDASVAAREAEQRAARRRVRWTIGGLVGALVVISVFASVAVWFWRNADESARLDRARLLVEQGQNVFEERPLFGLRLAIEGLAGAPTANPDAYNSMLKTVRELAGQGRLLKFGADIEAVYPSSDGSVFILDQPGKPGELRRTADASLLATLPSEVSSVDPYPCPTPDSPACVVHYENAPAELRRTSDLSLIETFEDGDYITAISPDLATSYYIVKHEDAPYELRRTVDKMRIATLMGNVRYVAFSPDTAATYLVVTYNNAPGELRRTADGSLITVLTAHPIPQSMYGTFSPAFFSSTAIAPAFVVNYDDAPGELRRLSDGKLITTLTGVVERAVFSPDPAAAYFVVSYRSSGLTDPPIELRRIADGERVTKLTEPIETAFFGLGSISSSFVVSYSNAPGELRRLADGKLIARLTDKVVPFPGVAFSSDSSATYFVVNYENSAAELRRASDGVLVTTLAGSPFANNVSFSSDSAATYVALPSYRLSELRRTADGALLARIMVDDANIEIHFISSDPTVNVFIVKSLIGRAELWAGDDHPRRLIDLGLGLETRTSYEDWRGPIFDPTARHVVMRYRGGRVYLVDVAWLAAMGGDPGALSAEVLVRLACEGPLASGLWTAEDQQALEAALDGRPPQACS
jgi:hypothetical protein